MTLLLSLTGIKYHVCNGSLRMLHFKVSIDCIVIFIIKGDFKLAARQKPE